MTVCAFPGCQHVARARGWCTTHYCRWWKHGDPAIVLPKGGHHGNHKPRPPRVWPVCKFDGCTNLSAKSCKGWCPKHHTRWVRHGDPSVVNKPPVRFKDTTQTIRDRTVLVGECWIWQGALLPNGYGVFGVGGQRYVHRAAWELANGAIPKGKVIHHTCLKRACCNPAHLKPVTPLEHAAEHRELRQAA